jgi:hypothetical protein
MPPKKVSPNGKAAEPAGAKATPARKPVAKKTAAPRKTSSTGKYLRNIRGVEVRVTFHSGRKIELASRGQRGDMAAITKEELDDAIFLGNLGIIYEVISSAEAQKIRDKQFTNVSSMNHPRPEQIIKSQLGKDIEFTGVEPSNEEISIPVGTLVEKETRYTKGPEVTRSVQPERAEVPGSTSLNQYQPVSIAPLPPISERE